MKIPESCRLWEQQMEAGEKERRILENIRLDTAIDPSLEERFFDRIARSPTPNSPEEAHKIAYNIVKNDPLFLYQGNRVPDDKFLSLLRIEFKTNLWYIFSRESFKEKGIRRKDAVARLRDEEVNSLIEEYRGSLNLGNELGIVWVTDLEKAKSCINNPSELLDRLGIPLRKNICIIILYRRDERDLFVPRSFDGIKEEHFSITLDNAKNEGYTKPLTSSDEGLPEAIHRSCGVTPMSIKVSILP